MNSRKALWHWVRAIQQSDLPPATKHVCLNLHVYMESFEKGCFPSLSKQIIDTGLARSTLVKHLKTARERGYLIIEKTMRNNSWKLNRYFPALPKNVNVSDELTNDYPSSPAELGSSVADRGSSIDDINVVRHLNSNDSYNGTYNDSFNEGDSWESGF